MMSKDNVEAAVEEVLELEKVRSTAITTKDHATLQRILCPDYVYVHCSGRIDTKESYIDRILTGKSNYYTLTFSNVKARSLGEVVIVWGDVIMDLRLPSRPRVLNLRFTNIWARAPEGWRNVHWIAAPNDPPV